MQNIEELYSESKVPLPERKDIEIPEGLKDNLIVTTVASFVDTIYNWARSNSVWPLTYGTACCIVTGKQIGRAHV